MTTPVAFPLWWVLVDVVGGLALMVAWYRIGRAWGAQAERQRLAAQWNAVSAAARAVSSPREPRA